MKNIIWANAAGDVKVTCISPEYEGTSQNHAEEISAGDGFAAVLFNVDTFGLGASDLVFKNGQLSKNKEI